MGNASIITMSVYLVPGSVVDKNTIVTELFADLEEGHDIIIFGYPNGKLDFISAKLKRPNDLQKIQLQHADSLLNIDTIRGAMCLDVHDCILAVARTN